MIARAYIACDQHGPAAALAEGLGPGPFACVLLFAAPRPISRRFWPNRPLARRR